MADKKPPPSLREWTKHFPESYWWRLPLDLKKAWLRETNPRDRAHKPALTEIIAIKLSEMT